MIEEEVVPRKTILRGGLVLRPGDDPPVIVGADLYIQDRYLVAVGEAGQPFPAAEADEVLDLSGHVVMPGLINAHTHTPLTYLRGVAQDVDMGGFFNRMGPYYHLVRREYAYWTTLLALTEMIRNGVTTCLDMFEWMDEVGRAVKQSGMRAGLACELAGVGPAPKGKRGSGFSLSTMRMILDDKYGRERLKQAEAEVVSVRALNCDRLIPYLGPHALYSCSPDLLAETAALAQKLAVSISIHLAENRSLESQVRRRYGSSARLLEETGLLKQHCIGAHCIYLTPAEVERLAGHHFGVAHCPTSNLKLGEQLAPVPAFLEAGIPVGLGTDSVMSNDNLDVLEEARLAVLVHKSRWRDVTVLAGDVALQMATCLGAEAMGIGDRVGRLRPGYLADLIVLNTSGPHWQPAPAPMMAVLYAASTRDVQSVMVDGVWVMRNRVIQTFNEAEVISNARRIVAGAAREK